MMIPRFNGSDLIEADKELCKRDMGHFLRGAWHILDPGNPYKHGWHMTAMAEHLKAVADGEITRLLINVPPGTSKSTLTAVMFPAWLWGPYGWPESRLIGASYAMDLATRDSRKTRLIIDSEWYQDRWPIKIASDANASTFFENEQRGFRQAAAVASMTGKRGDVILWDDPHSPEKAYSEAYRQESHRIFSETLPTRLTNPEKSGIIVVMQRLHEQDISGYILEQDLGYEHLCLPMEFEPERKCYTSIGFKDPRTEDGELLFPQRFPREVIDRDRKALGEFAFAGQYQQRPSPRGGSLFQREWFGIVGAAPNDCRWVRGWDFAATKDAKAAWTRGVLFGRSRSTRTFYIADVVGVQGTPNEVKQLLLQTAALDGKAVHGSIPQDPGQAGKSQVADLLSELAGFTYKATPESGDKITRAEPLAAQAEAGNVKMVSGAWNKEFLDEMTAFPAGKFADQVDAASRAFGYLVTEPEHTSGTMRLKL